MNCMRFYSPYTNIHNRSNVTNIRISEIWIFITLDTTKNIVQVKYNVCIMVRTNIVVCRDRIYKYLHKNMYINLC